jgi:cation diffusion facilitator CzcD-associated flavoprotein CzcO
METTNTTVACIGAGFSGIAIAIGLLERGVRDFVILEKASQLGGTWRENTYPGCACDVPSFLYSYSFARKSNWSRIFAEQPEIQRYLLDVAERHSITPHIHFETEALKSTWDESLNRWVIETNRGRYVSQFLVLGHGPLHETQIPKLPGLDKFTGTTFHSARWRHDHDLRGRRVAVLGTGSSAIQFVPKIQPQVERLVVFQRTAPWVLPKMDRALSTTEQWLLKHVPGLQFLVRSAIYLLTETLQLAQRSPAAMKQLQRIGLRHLRRQVKDPVLLNALTPKFTLGCKRMLFSNTWYSAVQSPNAEIVTHGATEVTADGIIGADGIERKVDTIIFGTGFFVTNTSMWKKVIGRDGKSLDDVWKGSPQAYVGTTCRGFPNAFLMIGPNTGNGHGSALVVIEAQARYVVDAIATAKRDAIATLEVRASAQDVWNDRVQSALSTTVFNIGGCASYYLDANGRNSSIYPWTTINLRRRLRRFDRAQYELLSDPKTEAGRAEPGAV